LNLTDGNNRFLPNTYACTRRHSVTFQKTTVIELCVGMMSEICDRKYDPYMAKVCLPIVFYYLWNYIFPCQSKVAGRYLPPSLNYS